MFSPPPDSDSVSAAREPDRLGASPSPPVVGVLLPLRLETRFSPPSGAAGWKLRVRIVPDTASIDRHDPDPTEEELDDVEAFWRACDGDLATERGKAEWSRFAARRGPARAAWLARSFPPLPTAGGVRIDRPATVSPGGRPGRVAGLPPTLELWLARGGGAPAQVATLAVPQTQLTLDLADPASGREPWWSSFASAVAAGLGAELDLGPEADDIDALYVIGAGGGDPAPLFRAHRDSGKLAVLPIGTPTNTVDGAPAADLAKDPETWHALLLAGAAGAAGAQAVSSALTGGTGELGPLPGGAAHHLEVNQAIVAALWPAVFGHGLNDVLALSGTPEAGAWALDNLVPEGPFPPLRIDDQPFGLLPVTDLAAWTPAPGDPAVEEAIRPSLLELRDGPRRPRVAAPPSAPTPSACSG